MFLTFSSALREKAYLLFVAGRPLVSSCILMLVLLIIDLAFAGNTVDAIRQEGGGIISVVNVIGLVLFVGATITFCAAVVLDRGFPGMVAPPTLRQATDMAFSVFLFATSIAGVTTMARWRNENCERHNKVYRRDNSPVYYEADCYRRLGGVSYAFLILLVVKRIRFKYTFWTNFAVVLVYTLLVATLPQESATLGAAAVMFCIAFVAFVTFIRFDIERGERIYFAQHERLQESLVEIEERTAELETFVHRLLPPALLERSAGTKKRKRLDSSATTSVLVINAVDFVNLVSATLPGELAETIETARFRIEEWLTEMPTIVRVSVFLDEFTIVGNLVTNADVCQCVTLSCALAQRAVSKAINAMHLKAAIHVGEVSGGFIGSHWVRYDVWGPGINATRAIAQVADARMVILSEEALFAARDYLIVTEGPELETPHMDESFGAGTVQQTWALQQCDMYLPTSDIVSSSMSSQPSAPLTTSITDSSQTVSSKPMAQQINALVADKAALQSDLMSVTHRKWLFYCEFNDPEVEEGFVSARRETMLGRAVRVWLAFAALLLVHVIVLLMDMYEPRGVIGMMFLVIAILLSLVCAYLPFRFGRVQEQESNSKNTSDTWYTCWQLLTVLVPLLAVFAEAATRPSALGSDVRLMMLTSILARSTTFLHARHQIMVTPLLLLLAHVQYFVLPGGIIGAEFVVVWAVAVFVIVSDRDNDIVQRENYLTERRIVDATDQSAREVEVRHGLIRSTIPVNIIELALSEKVCSTIFTAPDTFVVYVTMRNVTHGIGTDTTRLERALDKSLWLSTAMFHGDSVLLLSPVAHSDESAAQSVKIGSDAHKERTEDILAFAAALDDGDHRVLVEQDTTNQVITTHGLPTYTAIGIGVTRILAIAATASDAVSSGVLLTERVHRFATHSGAMSGYQHQVLPRWRIRGVGVLRMVRLIPG